jgi:hypothetical protein
VTPTGLGTGQSLRSFAVRFMFPSIAACSRAICADGVELIPVDDQDIEERVFRAWERSARACAAAVHADGEFAIPIRQIEEIIDRMLPTFDAKNQLFAFKRELRRLEDLSGEFFAIAKRDKNPECGHLVARLNERICAMRGIGPMSVRTDPLAVQVAQQPSSHDRITAVLMNLKYGPNGDGAAPSDAAPPADDADPNR